ncbi:MAG: hypothetical protein ACRD0H_04085, partial [Actinomycetes bacterium]
ELLSQLASPPHPVGLVVVGVRADFYATCANYPHLRTALQDNPLVVGPMSDTELRAAIRSARSFHDRAWATGRWGGSVAKVRHLRAT